MKRKALTAGLMLFGGLAALLIIRFVIGGDEDNWICVKGEWVRHGNPVRPAPSGGCET